MFSDLTRATKANFASVLRSILSEVVSQFSKMSTNYTPSFQSSLGRRHFGEGSISHATKKGHFMTNIWRTHLTGAWHTGIRNPRGRKIMNHWMNTLFVFRHQISRTLFCARKLIRGHNCHPKICSGIFSHPKPTFSSFKNDLKSTVFVGIHTMSKDSGENSSLLDNLRKSVKEQVGRKYFLML